MADNGFAGFVKRAMVWWHRRRGDRFLGLDVLYLTTTGARTGQTRLTPLAYFPGQPAGWLIVASNAGADRSPAWYHNLKAHPDDVRAEVGGRTVRVTARELSGEERDAAWRQITAGQQRYARYQQKTTRTIPVLLLAEA